MIRSLYKQFHADQSSLFKRLALSMTEIPRTGNDILVTTALTKSLSYKAKKNMGKGQGVIVIPGFLGRDRFNKPLINFLNKCGYQASGWMLGRNTGPGNDMRAKLTREIEFRYKQTGQKVILVGHSLGGIYAREIARSIPDQISQVITLGSPFSRDENDRTAVSKLFWTINKDTPAAKIDHKLSDAPNIPVTSIFTRADGVINWQTSTQSNSHKQSENIEVYGSHFGLTQNASVWYALLDRLAQDSQQWRQFDNQSGWRKYVFPVAYSGQGNFPH